MKKKGGIKMQVDESMIDFTISDYSATCRKLNEVCGELYQIMDDLEKIWSNKKSHEGNRVLFELESAILKDSINIKRLREILHTTTMLLENGGRVLSKHLTDLKNLL